jgi:acyl-CoA thioester hydrolase
MDPAPGGSGRLVTEGSALDASLDGTVWSTHVDPAWIDYNGHVNDSAYAVLAARANEDLLDSLGFGQAYAEAGSCSLYTASLAITYRHEIGPDDLVDVQRRVARVGRTSLTLETRMLVGEVVCAETETVLVHVGPDGPVPWSEDQRRVFDAAG